MPTINLTSMSIDALIDLRQRVEEPLVKRRAEIEQQLARMEIAVGGPHPKLKS
jgi:hypothetical protein